MADIIRTYSTAEHAESALANLRAEGLAGGEKATPITGAAGTEWLVRVSPPFGTGYRATEILDGRYAAGHADSPHLRAGHADSAHLGAGHAGSTHAGSAHVGSAHLHPQAVQHEYRYDRPEGTDAISRLSAPVSPGAISSLSGRVNPGSIAAMSGPRPAGAIANLSGRRSPGSVARLSGRVSPGAISRLSATGAPGAISSLSSGWYVSRLFGMPLLTSSQAPTEPDGTLLTDDRRHAHHRR